MQSYTSSITASLAGLSFKPSTKTQLLIVGFVRYGDVLAAFLRERKRAEKAAVDGRRRC